MQGEVEALVGGQCAFCPDPECPPAGAENLLRRLPHLLGPLLGPIHVNDCEEEEVFVHSVCAIWSPEVRCFRVYIIQSLYVIAVFVHQVRTRTRTRTL